MDDGDDEDGVAQHGGHTPNNRSTETCSLDLPFTSLILDIHVLINLHLSKQGICWPVSRYHIAGQIYNSSRSPVFLKLTADQLLVFDGSRAHVRLTFWKQGRIVRKPVNASPGFKFIRITIFSSIQMLFAALFCYKTHNRKRKPHRKSNLKFYLFLG